MVKRIKEYDNKLFVEWDTHKRRFCIYRKPSYECGPTTPIMVVQNDDKSFRPLDMRVMQKLRESDLWHNENLVEDMDNAQMAREKVYNDDFRDTNRQIAKELYSTETFFGSSARGTGWRKE